MSESNVILNEIDESGMTQCFNLKTSDFEDRFSGMHQFRVNWVEISTYLWLKKRRNQI